MTETGQQVDETLDPATLKSGFTNLFHEWAKKVNVDITRHHGGMKVLVSYFYNCIISVCLPACYVGAHLQHQLRTDDLCLVIYRLHHGFDGLHRWHFLASAVHLLVHYLYLHGLDIQSQPRQCSHACIVLLLHCFTLLLVHH